MITEYLNEQTVRLQLHAQSREEAVELAAAPLLERGDITPLYVTQMKEAMAEMGPYMVILPGVALAHAKPGPEVLNESISLATFAQPVVFGHKKNDPVRVVFVLASPQKDRHLKVLLSISRLLAKPEFLDLLHNTNDVGELLEYINEEEERNEKA